MNAHDLTQLPPTAQAYIRELKARAALTTQQIAQAKQQIATLTDRLFDEAEHIYVQHDTTTLFSALDLATGAVMGQLHRLHRTAEFLKFLRTIEQNVPSGLDIHLHFTPMSGSRLNLVERWLVLLTERQIKRASHRSTVELERAIRDYLAVYNQSPTPFVWHKTADQIIESVGRFCTRINDSGPWCHSSRNRPHDMQNVQLRRAPEPIEVFYKIIRRLRGELRTMAANTIFIETPLATSDRGHFASLIRA